METITPLQVDCHPEAAVSGPILLQSDYLAFLVFNAQQLRGSKYTNAGRAIAEIEDCWITKFGYHNDEAWSAIPRTKGLSYDVHEVVNSDWISEITRLNRYGFPDTPESTSNRHFLILFHDSSFECIASGLSITLSREPLADILSRLSARIVADK